MNRNELSARAGAALDAQVTSITPLHGGMIGEAYRIELADQRTVVAKVAQNTEAGLETEAYMLSYLHSNTPLPVPQVLHSDPHLLLMTFLSGTSQFSPAAQRHAAELLAALHNITAPGFGMERDTLLGPLPLPNGWADSWIDFFSEHRLLYAGQQAVKIGRLPVLMLTRLEKFLSALDHLLEEPNQPALIHGDIWASNVLASADRITGFIDPAIYYGHAEVELAYITMFSTFDTSFIERYHELRPIAPGFFEQRQAIYSLFPLLVHVYCFGGGYVNSVDSVLRRFGH
jgi:fructosamine-3-kinase